MGTRTRPSQLAAALVAALLFASSDGRAQNLGHKTLGTLGLRAGSQPKPGIYLVNRLAYYRTDELFDRNGDELPVGLDGKALAGSFGVAVAFELPRLGMFVNASVGLPMAHATINTVRPEASIDRFGLGDLYVQPAKLGWRMGILDLVTGYAVYAPTGRFQPAGSGGIGRGHWTHELSLGGTAYFDAARTWHLSALASYDLNLRKRGIDLTRGDTLQVQGGFGVTVLRFLDVGIAGYALWQLRDDRGADVPLVLRGARDRVYGVGPELGVKIPLLQAAVTARYEHDFAVESRPRGEIFVLQVSTNPWPVP